MSGRADRLGASLVMFGLVNQPPREAMEASFPLLSMEAKKALRDVTAEDIALSNACLTVEREHRARQWAALEAFGAAWAGGEGEIETMDADDARAALRAAYELGWNFAAPDQEE